MIIIAIYLTVSVVVLGMMAMGCILSENAESVKEFFHDPLQVITCIAMSLLWPFIAAELIVECIDKLREDT